MRAPISPPRNFRLFLLLVSLLGTAASAQAQLDEAAAKQLKTQAEECSRAFVEGDFERLVDYTHPKVVEMAGGREKMVEFVRKDVAEMKAEGFEPLSFAPGEPSQVLKDGAQTYVVVPAKLRMRTPGTVYVSESFLIGVSADGGKTWKFISGSNGGRESLKLILPEAAAKLDLPPARHYPEEKAP